SVKGLNCHHALSQWAPGASMGVGTSRRPDRWSRRTKERSRILSGALAAASRRRYLARWIAAVCRGSESVDHFRQPQRHLELQAPLFDRVSEQLLGLLDAVHDRVA